MDYKHFEATLHAERVFHHGTFETITVELRHNTVEPYTVTITALEGAPWFIDRQMLRDGQNQAGGEGCVRVFPVRDTDKLVGMVGVRGEEDIVLMFAKEDINYFLNAVDNYCPMDEDRDEDIDEELKSLLA